MTEKKSSYTIRLKVEGDGTVTANLVKVGDTGEKQFKRLQNAGSQADLVMQGITKTITRRLIPAFSAASAARSIINNITMFEKIDARIQRLTESAAEYEDVQKFISQKANDLNIDITTFADNYARLLTLQRSGVISDFQVKNLAEGFANVGAALGATSTQIDQAMYGLSQTLTSGVVNMEDFKQVTEPLPGLMQELDKAAGVGAGGFRRLVADGKITSEFFATVLISALNSYQGAAAATADTVGGAWTRLKNQWVELARTLQKPVANTLVPILDTLSQALNLITKLEEKRDGILAAPVGGPITDIRQQLKDLQELNKEIERQQKVLSTLDTPEKMYRFAEGPQKSLERLIPLADKLEEKFGPEHLRIIDAEINKIQASIAKAPAPTNGRSWTEVLEKDLANLEKLREKVVQITGEISAAPPAIIEKQSTAIADFIQSLNEQIQVLSVEGKARAQLRAELQLQNIARKEEIALTPQQIAQARELVGKVYDLEQSQKKQTKAKQDALATIKEEIAALSLSDRELFVHQTMRRFTAEQIGKQREELKKHIELLYDEKEAMEEQRKEEDRRKETIQKIVKLTEDQADAQTKYNKEVAELNELYRQQLITAPQLAAAEEDARQRMLWASTKWIDGVKRALESYEREAKDAAYNAEQVTLGFLNNAEDAFVDFANTGKFEWKELLNSLIDDINRALVRQNITGPLAGALNSVISNIDFGNLFSSLAAKGGAYNHGHALTAYARGGIVNKPTIFPMANGAGLMGEAGPEAILPLRRLPSGNLGVESGGAASPLYMVNVDARGSSDPNATAAQVEMAVDRALSARVPGIIRASSSAAKSEIIDSFQRRGGRFD